MTSADGPPILNVEGLSFSYPNGHQVLREISFSVAAGERLAILGANGAGKSTLLLALLGLLSPVSVRKLELEGQELRSDPAQLRRRLNLVFQNPDDQLFCPTIAEDVAFGPRNLGMNPKAVAEQTRAALAALGIEDLADRRPHELSLGQRKLASIATVLSMDPALMAFDEPTSSLDPRGRRELISLMGSLTCAQLIVTHDYGLVETLCQRAIVLANGGIIASREARELVADEAWLMEHGLA